MLIYVKAGSELVAIARYTGPVHEPRPARPFNLPLLDKDTVHLFEHEDRKVRPDPPGWQPGQPRPSVPSVPLYPETVFGEAGDRHVLWVAQNGVDRVLMQRYRSQLQPIPALHWLQLRGPTIVYPKPTTEDRRDTKPRRQS